MAENLPLKCTLKNLEKTYSNIGKEIIAVIVGIITVLLDALPGIIVVALVGYGYLITVGSAMYPYIKTPPNGIITSSSFLIAFGGLISTLALLLEIVCISVIVMYVLLRVIYKKPAY